MTCEHECSTWQYEKQAVVLREKFLVEKSKYEASKPPATEPVGKAMSKDKAGGKEGKDTKDKPKPPKVLPPLLSPMTLAEQLHILRRIDMCAPRWPCSK